MTYQGLLEFRDGLLVEALRHGHWIILDELNLAPSDVLEGASEANNTPLLTPFLPFLNLFYPFFTLFILLKPCV